jgi:CRISPR-associated protein Cmr4
MFKIAKALYIYVETALHAGTGRGLGSIDLPIQRDTVTNIPHVQATSIKGKLRSAADDVGIDRSDTETLFGPDSINTPDGAFAGALAPGDAKLLLFPVRSLAGVFAWTTCIEVLRRFVRDMSVFGLTPPELGNEFDVPAGSAAINTDNILTIDSTVVLDEFPFDAKQQAAIGTLATWIVENVLPTGAEYQHWRDVLPKRLIVLNNDDFRNFTEIGTEVQTHVRLNRDRKTVVDGALWVQESLPAESVLYALVGASASRNGSGKSADQMLALFKNYDGKRVQLGGDETTARGIVSLRVS